MSGVARTAHQALAADAVGRCGLEVPISTSSGNSVNQAAAGANSVTAEGCFVLPC